MSDKCVITLNKKALNLDATRRDIIAIALLVDNPLSVSVASRMTTLEGKTRKASESRVAFVNAFAGKGNPDDVFEVTFEGTSGGKKKVTVASSTRKAIAERLLLASRFSDLAIAKEVTIEGKVITEKGENNSEELSADDLV